MFRAALLFTTVVRGAAAGFGAGYDVIVTCEKTVTEETAEAAAAFGLPEFSKTVTELNVSVGTSEEVAGGWRITVNGFDQNLFIGETKFGDEEGLRSSLAGRWVEFTSSGLAEGDVIKDPSLTVESEYVDWGLLAFLLLYPAAEGRDGPFSTVERVLTNGNTVLSTLSSGAGGAEGEYRLTLERELAQDTRLSKMNGSAVLSGVAKLTPGADGFAETANAELSGLRERSFEVAGREFDLKEDIKMSITATRTASRAEG